MTGGPVTEQQYGDVVLTRLADGSVVVEGATDTILVSKQMLNHPDFADRYIDGVLTLDTAGEYRYRRVRAHDQHGDVFERVAGQPSGSGVDH